MKVKQAFSHEWKMHEEEEIEEMSLRESVCVHVCVCERERPLERERVRDRV